MSRKNRERDSVRSTLPKPFVVSKPFVALEPKKLEEKPKESKPEKKIRYWNGNRVYECHACPFNALDELSVKKHFDVVHKAPEAPPRGHLVLTDRFGNEKGRE